MLKNMVTKEKNKHKKVAYPLFERLHCYQAYSYGGILMAWDNELDKESAAYKFAADDSKIIRVVAGPGTGKSYGLKRRVARLLEQGQDPQRILAVTFTRTAAQDLKNEIHSIGITGADEVVAKTLHSFCFGVLNKRNIIERTGRVPRPILDFEQKPMLYDVSNLFGSIKEKQNRLLAFESAWARLQSEEPGFPLDETDRAFEKEVKKWLKTHKSMLFGEMIIETFHFLRNNPMCTERQEFDHILVDEYQDLNKAEQAVIDLLASNCNLAIIGDDDQSIYSFKYANPEGIREFPQTHPGCNAIDFDSCRRCPQKVVAMASRLISHNTNRTLGDLHAFKKNQDGIVKIIQWESLDAEIKGICKIVSQEIENESIRPEDVLILSPVRKIGYRVRDELVKSGINAKSYFRESAIISDDLKFNFELLALLANPKDMVALRYLLGSGNQTCCSASYKYLYSFAEENEMTTLDALEKHIAGDLSIPHISSLVSRYNTIKEKIAELQHAAQMDINLFIDLLATNKPENCDFRNILSEAIDSTSIDREENVTGWFHDIYSHAIEKISFPEDTSEHDHVRIMSFHASKGLSAKYVIVMSAIDELIPRINTDSAVGIDRQIEEQRRLFYVAITRCKSSSKDYPGTLIISSFTGLPGNEALEISIPTRNAYYWREVSASRFIRDFEETAPQTIQGAQL